MARLGFVRAMFAGAGVLELTLYRGYAVSGGWTPDRAVTLVAASADRAVAESHFDAPTAAGVLQRATVGIDRIFMTWLETPQLSHPYRESEVVLIAPSTAAALF